ncbi:MAG: hypothetical protein V4645_30060 [Pseudomonadota bacterium]
MAAVPVGTVIHRDEFAGGTWAAGRSPDESFGPLSYSICTNGAISGGDVIGTQLWSSSINDRRGVLVPSTPIETTGYQITFVSRIVGGAAMPGTNYWDGADFRVYSDGAGTEVHGMASMNGFLGAKPRIVVWGASGSETIELTDEPDMVANTYYTLRVDVGTMRQDYYWNGTLVAQTARTANLTIGYLQHRLGYTNAAQQRVSVVTIPDIAPPPAPSTTWRIRDDMLGPQSTLMARMPNTLVGVDYTWDESTNSYIEGPNEEGKGGGVDDSNSVGLIVLGDGTAVMKKAAF